MSNDAWRERAQTVYATTTVHSGFVPAPDKRARRVYLYGADGNKYLDFCSGVGVANCGHGNREIEKAITGHLRKTGRIQYIHHDFHNPEAIAFAEFLCEMVKHSLRTADLYKVFFANSGTEANEAGLKLVFSHRPKRRKILVFKGGFHGRTLGSLSLMRRPAHVRDYPLGVSAEFLTFPRRRDTVSIVKFQTELDRLEGSAEEYNSVVLEPVQGEAGIYLFDREAMKSLANFCSRHRIFIHVDEVQAGYGRTGKFLASEHFPGLQPDIVTLAKAIANGYPFAAVIFRNFLDWNEKGRHSSTYGGNALGAAAASATLDYLLKHDLIGNSERLGKILSNFLREFCQRRQDFVMNVRGSGLMQAVDFGNAYTGLNSELRDQVVATAEKNGLILIGAGEAAVRIMPPLVIGEKELMAGLAIFERSVEESIVRFPVKSRGQNIERPV